MTGNQIANTSLQPGMSGIRRAMLMWKLSSRKHMPIPTALVSANLTDREKRCLASLEARSSSLGAARENFRVENRRRLLWVIPLSIPTMLLPPMFDLPMASWFMEGIFTGDVVLIALYYGWLARTSGWKVSQEWDWDVSLSNSCDKLTAHGIKLPPSLKELSENMGYRRWPDVTVYRRLGAVDSLGMIRLANTLKHHVETVSKTNIKSVQLDGGTEELLSRVNEIAVEMKEAQDHLRISAMAGLEELVPRPGASQRELGNVHGA